MDLVVTWVDDQWPGYLDRLRAHARLPPDLNPNRTRDNLDLLRYGLRGVTRHAPWIGTIHLLTQRPQVPRWLNADHPRVRIHHHDEVLPAQHLPTFNSFAIYTALHRLPGLSDPFLFLEDDMLLLRPVQPQHFIAANGRLRVFESPGRTPPARDWQRTDISPWNAALAHANHLMDQRFGAVDRRPDLDHAPLVIDKALWQATLDLWPEVTAATQASRFRAVGNVPPEYLYRLHALATGRAQRVPPAQTARELFYLPLENWWLHARYKTWQLARRQPWMATLNDNFGARPNPRVVAHIRRALERWLPGAGPLERAAGESHRR